MTNKNTITTGVLIKDGDTLVLGGLIQDNITNSDKAKTDFLIFLQPHILRDDRQAAIESDAKYNYLRDEQGQLNKDQDAKLPLLPFQPADVMPPINQGESQSGALGANDFGDEPTSKHKAEGAATDVPSASSQPLAPSPVAATPLPAEATPASSSSPTTSPGASTEPTVPAGPADPTIATSTTAGSP